MPFQIHFSPRASVEYDKVMDYVIFNFGMQTASEIEEDFDRSGKYLEIVSFRGNLMNPNKINL